MLKLSGVLIIFFSGVWCQVISFGKCPEIDSVQQNFNLTGYTGRWYEALKYSANFEQGKKCIFADYSLLENGTLRVLNQDIDIKTLQKGSIEGNARPAGAKDEGKLLVKFPSKGARAGGPYWILETDYDNYAVVWACSESQSQSQVQTIRKFAWILTRSKSPSEETLNKGYKVFDRLSLSKKDLVKTDQTNCQE